MSFHFVVSPCLQQKASWVRPQHPSGPWPSLFAVRSGRSTQLPWFANKNTGNNWSTQMLVGGLYSPISYKGFLSSKVGMSWVEFIPIFLSDWDDKRYPPEVENMVVEAADMMKENAARLTFPAARLWVKSEFREVHWTLDLLSNEKKPVVMSDEMSLPSYVRFCYINQDIRIQSLNNQDSMESKSFFFVFFVALLSLKRTLNSNGL